MQEKADEEKRTLFRNLMARRVPQILCVYLAACWAILQFIDWIVNRYTMSPFLPDLGLVIFLSLIPSVLIVAYFHGKPGKNRWHRTETFVIPVNLAAVAVFVFFLFSGKDLGSTQKKVTVSDESGQKVEKMIPKSQFRKKITLFFFENQSGARENDWLQYGIPNMLQIDFSQDMYIDTLSPNSQDLKGNFFVFNEIRRAGFKTGTGLPMMLMKKIAVDFHQDYFLYGRIAKQGTSYRIGFSLHRAEDMKQLAQDTISDEDIFRAVDQLTIQLKKGMGIPSGYLAKAPDLPIAEIFTNSVPAAQLFTSAVNEVVFDQNWKKAQELLEQAVKVDSSFAFANMQLSSLYVMQNKTKEWQNIQKTLMRQLYKLPERQQYYCKLGYYAAMQEPDKQLAVLNMLIGLFPDDVNAYYLQAQMYIMRNKLDMALASYRKIQEIDSQNHEVLQGIAVLYEKKGDYGKAEQYYREYETFFPGSAESYVWLGRIKQKQGAHAQAREFFQKALLIKPDDIDIMIESAKCEFNLGSLDGALELFQKVLAQADSAESKYKGYKALGEYYSKCGQLSKALECNMQKNAEHKKFAAPLLALMEEVDSAPLLVKCGKADEAFQKLAALQKQLPSPYNQFVASGYIDAYLEQSKADEAEKNLPDISSLIKAMGADVLQVFILESEGRIAEIRGDYQKAIGFFLEQKKLAPADIDVNRRLAGCYRLLKEFARADECLKATLLASPFDPDANFAAAQLYWEMGKKEEALKFLKTAEAVWRNADANFAPARQVQERLKGWTI